ncbi:hypothetical protein [Facilibium subflavum]|uniref:hypothetical protein n=1 Tax=Facilibium subflavum TaxID=2219058 RepID=UPI000E6469B7|nr:hypothetical protein [Facilibium subflavum]
MNIIEKNNLIWQLKSWKLNAILITIILTLSLTANLIGHRLIIIFGVTMYSGAFLRIAALILLNVIRSYSKGNTIIFFIIIFINLCDLFAIGYGHFISYNLGFPTYFKDAAAYQKVFSDAWHGFVGEITSVVIYLILELFLFSYIYFKWRLPFFLSVIIAASLIMFIASYATMYAGFVLDYPAHIEHLILDNFIRNMIVLIIFSIISQPFVYWLHRTYFES